MQRCSLQPPQDAEAKQLGLSYKGRRYSARLQKCTAVQAENWFATTWKTNEVNVAGAAPVVPAADWLVTATVCGAFAATAGGGFAATVDSG